MYKKLEFESADKESFEVDGKDRKCAGYKTTITSDYMIECVDIFEDYMDALKGAGPKLKEMVLERAEREGNLDLREFKRLVDFAYPDPV